MLEVDGVTAGYGAVSVLHSVSLTVNEGEVVALLGPNGAGKTTLLRVVSGLLAPSAGRVVLRGQSTDGATPEALVDRGVQFIPEGGGVHRTLTVLENLTLAARPRRHQRHELQERLDEAFATFPHLTKRRTQLAATLSGGERQMLALAQAVVTRAPLLLIDEASLGLAPALVDSLFSTIVSLRQRGRAVLLVEQNAAGALNIADRAYVLEKGRIVAAVDDVKTATREHLARLYLGELEANN